MDADSNFDVTWQYNGDTVQISYRVLILNLSNVSQYDTGTVTSDASTHTLPASTLVNGNTYKLQITNTSSEGTVESQYVIFKTYANPTLVLDTTPSTTQAFNFQYNYASTQSEPIKQYEMFLYLSTDLVNPIETSGVQYPTNLTIPYTSGSVFYVFDGMLSDTTYDVKCVVETQSETIIESALTEFTITYVTPNATPNLITTVNNSDGSVTLNWVELSQQVGFTDHTPIYGTGKFNNALTLQNGENVYWDVATSPFTAIDPQNFTLMGFYKLANDFMGSVSGTRIDTLIEFDDNPVNNMRVFYNVAEKRFGFQYGNYITVGRKHPLVDNDTWVFIAVRDKSVYVQYDESGIKSELIQI